MTTQEEKENEYSASLQKQQTKKSQGMVHCFHWDHLGDCDHGTEGWQMGTVMKFTVGVCAQIMWRDKHQIYAGQWKTLGEFKWFSSFAFSIQF